MLASASKCTIKTETTAHVCTVCKSLSLEQRNQTNMCCTLCNRPLWYMYNSKLTKADAIVTDSVFVVALSEFATRMNSNIENWFVLYIVIEWMSASEKRATIFMSELLSHKRGQIHVLNDIDLLFLENLFSLVLTTYNAICTAKRQRRARCLTVNRNRDGWRIPVKKMTDSGGIQLCQSRIIASRF